jgi:hypothetical protein
VAVNVINSEFGPDEIEKRQAAKRVFSSLKYMSDIETDSEDDKKYIRKRPKYRSARVSFDFISMK